MKHEVLTRAIGELDDELIADAYAYKPRKRYALPRFLAAAACLVLVLAAALAMTRDTLPAEIKVEGAALSSNPIPISQPAAMALDARGFAQPRLGQAIELFLSLGGIAVA